MITKLEKLRRICDKYGLKMEYHYHADYPVHWKHLRHWIRISFPYLLNRKHEPDISLNEKNIHIAVTKITEKLTEKGYSL